MTGRLWKSLNARLGVGRLGQLFLSFLVGKCLVIKKDGRPCLPQSINLLLNPSFVPACVWKDDQDAWASKLINQKSRQYMCSTPSHLISVFYEYI
jgi:hypothetical protein